VCKSQGCLMSADTFLTMSNFCLFTRPIRIQPPKCSDKKFAHLYMATPKTRDSQAALRPFQYRLYTRTRKKPEGKAARLLTLKVPVLTIAKLTGARLLLSPFKNVLVKFILRLHSKSASSLISMLSKRIKQSNCFSIIRSNELTARNVLLLVQNN
jgi:hypothetical protein